MGEREGGREDGRVKAKSRGLVLLSPSRPLRLETGSTLLIPEPAVPCVPHVAHVPRPSRPEGRGCEWDVRDVSPSHVSPFQNPSKSLTTFSDPLVGWDNLSLSLTHSTPPPRTQKRPSVPCSQV